MQSRAILHLVLVGWQLRLSTSASLQSSVHLQPALDLQVVSADAIRDTRIGSASQRLLRKESDEQIGERYLLNSKSVASMPFTEQTSTSDQTSSSGWPKYRPLSTQWQKCEKWDTSAWTKASSKDSCQAKAAKKGHRYFQYSDHESCGDFERCLTLDSCKSPTGHQTTGSNFRDGCPVEIYKNPSSAPAPSRPAPAAPTRRRRSRRRRGGQAAGAPRRPEQDRKNANSEEAVANSEEAATPKGITAYMRVEEKDCGGGDIVSITPKPADLNECAEKCNSDERCWSFQANWGGCYLKRVKESLGSCVARDNRYTMYFKPLYQTIDNLRCYCEADKPVCANTRGGGKCFDMVGGESCALQGRGYYGTTCPAPTTTPTPASTAPTPALAAEAVFEVRDSNGEGKQVAGRIHRVSGKCYYAMGDCSGSSDCLKSPDKHRVDLYPVPCQADLKQDIMCGTNAMTVLSLTQCKENLQNSASVSQDAEFLQLKQQCLAGKPLEAFLKQAEAPADDNCGRLCDQCIRDIVDRGDCKLLESDSETPFISFPGCPDHCQPKLQQKCHNHKVLQTGHRIDSKTKCADEECECGLDKSDAITYSFPVDSISCQVGAGCLSEWKSTNLTEYIAGCQVANCFSSEGCLNALDDCIGLQPTQHGKNGCLAYGRGWRAKSNHCDACKQTTRQYGCCSKDECHAFCEEIYDLHGGGSRQWLHQLCSDGCDYMHKNGGRQCSCKEQPAVDEKKCESGEGVELWRNDSFQSCKESCAGNAKCAACSKLGDDATETTYVALDRCKLVGAAGKSEAWINMGSEDESQVVPTKSETEADEEKSKLTLDAKSTNEVDSADASASKNDSAATTDASKNGSAATDAAQQDAIAGRFSKRTLGVGIFVLLTLLLAAIRIYDCGGSSKEKQDSNSIDKTADQNAETVVEPGFMPQQGEQNDGALQAYMPIIDKIGRMDQQEIQMFINNIAQELPRTHNLAFHFTDEQSMEAILGPSSLGIRCGEDGLYVCNETDFTVEPGFDWQPWLGGDFRSQVVERLWDPDRAKEVLPGGPKENKLNVLFFLKVPMEIMESGDRRAAGRPDVTVIPSFLMTPSFDGFYFQRENIVRVCHLMQ